LARGARPAIPRIPSVLEPAGAHDPLAETTYEAVAFTDLQLDGAVAERAHFLGCRFTGCVLDRCELPGAAFHDVAVERLRGVEIDLAESSWRDALVADSLLAGAELYDARLQRVTFRDCKLDAVNLRGAKLTDVSFERCMLGEADFGRAGLRSVRFEGCRLVGVDFSGASLEEVDLRGSELEIARGYDSLGGAILSTTQLVGLAPGLAAQAGILIRDDP
jgi:uncharacterized protein YjbI with pentapeptide repeats